MVIHPKHATDAAPTLAAQTLSSPAKQRATESPKDNAAAQRWSELSIEETNAHDPMDAASADHLMAQLTGAMRATPADALNAQAGLNPQSVLDLIQ